MYYLLIVVLRITKKELHNTHRGRTIRCFSFFCSFTNRRKKKSRIKTHIKSDVYIQALFYCHERERERKKDFFVFAHTNIRTYIEKLHCTALHTYRYIYIYTHKVCHEYICSLHSHIRNLNKLIERPLR